jgi:hypothetical protein
MNTLYKIVFDGCLFTPYFIVQHKGMHKFKIFCVHCAVFQ